MKTAAILLTCFLACPVLAQSPAGGVAPPRLPSLKVQVKVGTKRDQKANSSYMQTMTISPQMILEGASTQPIPELHAIMIIVTMDTRAKYVSRTEKYDVHTNETLTVPAAERGARRSFEFKTSQVSFDAWRDTTNVGGAVYKYYVFGLRDPASKMLLHFETNNPQLDKLVREKPEKREEMLKLVAGAEFPNSFR